MIRNFGNKTAYDLFHSGKCKKLPKELWRRALFLLDVMEAVDGLEDLKVRAFPPSIRLHPLKHDRKGEFAIDINKVSGWRITFHYAENEFTQVKIEDYH